MGAVLLLKRKEDRCDVEAILVNRSVGGRLEVYSPIAKRAVDSGNMRRLEAKRDRYINGYEDLGFTDDSWEYWVMMQ